MSSVDDIGRNTSVVSYTVLRVVHYFSNSLQKTRRNEYYSILEKEFRFHAIYIHFEHILFFKVYRGYLNLKLS